VRVAVIGAGIVGVTTAYELCVDGHEVTVFERRGSIASESSFANAGVIAPGYVTPWAAPGMPGKVLGHLLSRHAPVRLHPSLDPAIWRWVWRWWRACRTRTWQANRLRMQRLAHYSRERLHTLTQTLHLDYERSEGYLVLLRETRDLTLARPALALLAELGTRFKLLDAAGCRSVEPGLDPGTSLHAGIHLPDDEVGNCRQFALLLRQEAQLLGARFRLNTEAQAIVPGSQPQLVLHQTSPSTATVIGAAGDASESNEPDTVPDDLGPVRERFDAVVVCAALGAPRLLRPHGLKLPLLPIYGYSVTASLRLSEQHPHVGPRSALMDERYKVAISRLGQRVRVAGSAELGGVPDRLHPKALATLHKVLNDWFPGAARLSQAQPWKGARPMLPDGPPVLGASGIDGVWLNLGHGSSGWALACGSARLLADALAARPPALDTEGLDVARLRG
jgi:D-amino-acid dehydrogenase